MASVTLENIKKSFGTVVAVDDVNLTINDHEFVVLVGPSGCGKTTTLRMIAGLETATAGNIYIGEKIVNDLPPKDRDIAMVFQNYALYPHMTVYDNLAFALKLRGYAREEIKQRVKQATKTLDIGHLLERKPAELSGGQKQRVALGRAIVRQPQVFLMDEPLSNIDAKLRIQMRAEISRLQNQVKTTTIYVTHDQTEAMTMAHRIVVMKDGQIQQVDTPLNIYNKPVNKFVAGFIGSPPMNFIDGQLCEKSGQLNFTSGSLKIKVSPKHVPALKEKKITGVTMGLRSENIYIEENSKSEALCRLDSIVDVVEPLGSEVIVYLKINETANFVSNMPPTINIQPGQKINVYLDMEKAHFFSAEDETVIV
jgi:multiple sugar transport system ATP-binding protein